MAVAAQTTGGGAASGLAVRPQDGVTALCASIQKLAKGTSSRTYGQFKLSGVSIVNGAQTVAAIARATKEHKDPVDARVWVRFISLEGCPPEFASDVTEATNTQNTVERSDFVALDPEQARLRTELLLSLQKTYSIKRGEETPPREHGCTASEATVALACAESEPSLLVIAKSAVGRLWEATDRPIALHLVFRELNLSVAEERGEAWDKELASVAGVQNSYWI